MSNTTLIVVVAVVAVAFAILWYQGQVRRFADYCREVKDELWKCSWPTWAELKGSTTVIVITIGLLGVFTVIIDEFLFFFKVLK